MKKPISIIFSMMIIILFSSCTKSGDSYTVQIPFDEEGNTLTLKCYIKDENLIVEQVLPDEYKDCDMGDPTVYKK